MNTTQSTSTFNHISTSDVSTSNEAQSVMHNIKWMQDERSRPVEATTSFVGQLSSGSEKTYADLQPVTSTAMALPHTSAAFGIVEPRTVLYNDTMMSQTEQPIHGGELVDEYGEALQYKYLEENGPKLLDDYAAADAPLEHDTLADSPQPFNIKPESYDSGDSNFGGNLPYKLLNDMEREREVPHYCRITEMKTESIQTPEDLEGEEMARNCFESPRQNMHELQNACSVKAASASPIYELSYPTFDATLTKEKAHRSAVYTFRFFLYLLTSLDPRLNNLVTWMDFQKPTDQPTKHALFKVIDKINVVQYWSNGSKGNCETTMRNTWGNLTTRMRYTRGEKNYGYFDSVVAIQKEEEGNSRCPRKRMFCFGPKVHKYLAQIKQDPNRFNSELEQELRGFPGELFMDKLPRDNLRK